MKIWIVFDSIVWILCATCVGLYVTASRTWNAGTYLCAISVVLLPISMVMRWKSKRGL